MPTSISNELPRLFRRRFGAEPRLFRAPGRVNLIGEHTDYNDGFVLPAALDLTTYVAIAPRADRLIRAYSVNLEHECAFDVDAPQCADDWSDYIRGVAVELKGSGHQLMGADVALLSTLPMGSGLSASAALEVAFGLAMLSLSGTAPDNLELAKICQRAENEFVGMRCGIMDQFISCHGVAGCSLLLDCRSLEARPIPIDPGVRILIANTMVHHQLATSAFNERRRECEEAVAALAPVMKEARALRDVSADDVERHATRLPGTLLRRARHVVSENARVIETANAFEARDFAQVGHLMNVSHESLREDYEVSCPELDLMVDLARRAPGVHGSRMTGGGFGGCTVSLVDAAAGEDFARVVGPAYQKATGLEPMIFSCFPGAGAGPV
jgi:galactokinase